MLAVQNNNVFFYNMTNMATPQHKDPSLNGHETYNLGRPFFDHHYCICMIYCHVLAKQISVPWIIKFTNLINPCFVIITNYSACLIYARAGVTKEIF